jgi:hypothetical protein
MEETAPQNDIFVTDAGCMDVICGKHMSVMKDEAILCNIGHFRPYKHSILAACPVVFASLVSRVNKGAHRPSARATYIASYAERLARKPHARDKSEPCSCRESPSAEKSRSACRPRRSVICRDRFSRRRTWHISTSTKCGACQACSSLARRA